MWLDGYRYRIDFLPNCLSILYRKIFHTSLGIFNIVPLFYIVEQNHLKKIIFLLLIIAALVFIFTTKRNEFFSGNETITDINGKIVKISSLLDKPLFVIFWSTSCTSCIKEMPIINDIKNKSNQFNVLAISMQYDQINDVRNFIKIHNYNFIYMHDFGSAFTSKFNVKFTPTIFKVKMDGRIENSTLGNTNIDKFFKND